MVTAAASAGPRRDRWRLHDRHVDPQLLAERRAQRGNVCNWRNIERPTPARKRSSRRRRRVRSEGTGFLGHTGCVHNDAPRIHHTASAGGEVNAPKSSSATVRGLKQAVHSAWTASRPIVVRPPGACSLASPCPSPEGVAAARSPSRFRGRFGMVLPVLSQTQTCVDPILLSSYPALPHTVARSGCPLLTRGSLHSLSTATVRRELAGHRGHVRKITLNCQRLTDGRHDGIGRV